MTETVLEIYNAALSAARARGRLNTLTQNSKEREECDIWYGITLQTVQEAAFWPSCKTTARLTLLKTRDTSVNWAAGDPEAQFLYKYQLPSDYLRAWHLTNYQSFTLSSSADETVLNTNAQNAVLVYARKSTNPARWTPGQRLATIYGLASFICGSLTGQNELKSILAQEADAFLREAQTQAGNAPDWQMETIPPQLAARGYEGAQQTDFYYPFGRSFSQALTNV